MSIQELLSKVNRSDESKKENFIPVVIKREINTNITEISKIPFRELQDLYQKTKSWLETHECQSNTNNLLDVNDRPYDPIMYAQKLKEFEDIVCEIFSRPLDDGLVEKVVQCGL